MDLQMLNINDAKIKQLNRVGVSSAEELIKLYPKHYRDRTKLTGLCPGGEESVFLFRLQSVRYVSSGKTPLVKASGYETHSGNPVQILWFNQAFRYTQVSAMVGKDILVAGTVIWQQPYGNKQGCFQVSSPAVFDPAGLDALRIYPVYRKVPGMAETYLEECIYRAAEMLQPLEETLPEQILYEHDLLDHAEMIRQLHWPTDMLSIEEAKHRLLWDDLLYFAMRIELDYRGTALGSPFNLPVVQKAKAVADGLPFALTPDQSRTMNEILRIVRSGRRLNALVQGDVGCGKTIIAVLLMAAFAENGYQAVLMAPTQLLASQHYETLRERLEPFGFKIAFVSGQKLRKAEQAALEAGIASGEFSLVVGTQALLSDNYKFKNLALVIEDEEHKYGVMQRKALTEKAALGTHTVTMTATPIPRTLAQTIYGENVQLFSIKTKPAGRLPVKTGHIMAMNQVLNIVYNEVKNKGHQAYVVCPMIAANEKMEGVAPAEETFEVYRKALEPYGISVGIVTGKTKKAEAHQVLRDFELNKINVLVSTTVIEVGINVPNASCIVIHNAERFGLAQLHQLRGRVGRGKDQAYCVLVSDDANNPRIHAMCTYNDGFQISEIDLQLRGAGDFLGSQQSGTEKYLALALRYSDEYAKAQKAARWILDTGVTCPLLSKAVDDHRNNVKGEILQC